MSWARFLPLSIIYMSFWLGNKLLKKWNSNTIKVTFGSWFQEQPGCKDDLLAQKLQQQTVATAASRLMFGEAVATPTESRWPIVLHAFEHCTWKTSLKLFWKSSSIWLSFLGNFLSLLSWHFLLSFVHPLF